MSVEIEAKWVGVDFEVVREKLGEVEGKLVKPMARMVRTTFNSGSKKSWIRVRDEGDGKVTMSYKEVKEVSVAGMEEVELVVDSYEKAVEFVEKVGFEKKSEQETRREIWEVEGVEVTLDEWPWLPPMVEIEAESEAKLEEVAGLLGFDMSEAMFASVDYVYAKYYDVTTDEVNNEWGEIKFSEGVPEWLEKRKNKC